jgi:hypothetical protein
LSQEAGLTSRLSCLATKLRSDLAHDVEATSFYLRAEAL